MKYTVAVLFVILIITQPSRGQELLNLKGAVETAVANNFAVNQAGLLVQKENVNLRQARLSRYPSLNANASYGINQGRSIDPFTNQYVNENVSYSNYSASSNLLVFNGLYLSNLIRADQFSWEASQKELQQAKDQLTINVILAYLNVLKAQDVLQQSEQQIHVSEKQVERLMILNQEGAVTPSDLYDLKGEVAANQLIVADNSAAVEMARLTLCQLMNVPYNNELQVEPLPIDSITLGYSETPQQVYEQALSHFAEIQSKKLRVQSAEKYQSAMKGKLFPSLSLGGDLNTNYSSVAAQSILLDNKQVASNDFVTVNGTNYPVMKTSPVYGSKKINFNDQLKNNLFTTFSVNMTVPLFNAGKARSNIRLAGIDLENARLEDKHARIALQQAVEEAYVNLQNASSRVGILQDQVNAFTESFRSAEIRFNNGVITSVDYLVAKNNLDRARINLITSRYDYALRKKILDYYKGSRLW